MTSITSIFHKILKNLTNLIKDGTVTASINFSSIATYKTYAPDPSDSLIEIYYNKAQDPESTLPYWTMAGYMEYAHKELIKNTDQIAQTIFEQIRNAIKSGKTSVHFFIETIHIQEHRELYQELFQQLFKNSYNINLGVQIGPNIDKAAAHPTRLTCQVIHIPLN